MEEVFVARQPIFDRSLRVFGYEILFRHSSFENFFSHHDPDEAATRVIHDSLHVFGLDVLAQDRRIFFNVTRSVLVENLVRILPVERTVVELLETVEPDPEVIEACRALKAAGYTLALDDFVIYPGCEPLLELADIVKVDFLASPREAREEVPRRFRRKGLLFLAEKVETAEDFHEALELGYDLFQGFFFRRPEILAAREIPSAETSYLRLLQAVSQEPIDFDRVEEIVKHDVSLSVRLLRFLNSAFFGWRSQVTSIKQALGLLGELPLRKWVTMVAVTGLGTDRPEELVVTALFRARFCEELAQQAGLEGEAPDLFVAGLLSALDSLLGRPLPDLLRELGVAPALQAAIAGGAGQGAAIFRLAIAYESGRWEEAAAIARQLGLDELALPGLYRDAVAWAEQTHRF
ncbi:EAL and HDOD domain-containing protein [Vulgatibacter sp.]|uniref:EAL and HDOD domain-containing protein n=1 Tax=Vulgatibacter sp. TaxID=1971226 RepID=UPI003565E61E